MTLCCPACGQPINTDKLPKDALSEIDLPLMERRVLNVLMETYPRKITFNAILDAIYAEDPNGGPDNADAAVKVFMYRLRKRLPPYGWEIPKAKGGKGNFGFYGLSPLEVNHDS